MKNLKAKCSETSYMMTLLHVIDVNVVDTLTK